MIRLKDVTIDGHDLRVWLDERRFDDYKSIVDGRRPRDYFRLYTSLLLQGWEYPLPTWNNNGATIANPSEDKTNAIFLEIKPGMVDFISSREALDLTDRTEAVIEQVYNKIYTEKYLKESIESLSDDDKLKVFYYSRSEHLKGHTLIDYLKGLEVITTDNFYIYQMHSYATPKTNKISLSQDGRVWKNPSSITTIKKNPTQINILEHIKENTSHFVFHGGSPSRFFMNYKRADVNEGCKTYTLYSYKKDLTKEERELLTKFSQGNIHFFDVDELNEARKEELKAAKVQSKNTNPLLDSYVATYKEILYRQNRDFASIENSEKENIEKFKDFDVYLVKIDSQSRLEQILKAYRPENSLIITTTAPKKVVDYLKDKGFKNIKLQKEMERSYKTYSGDTFYINDLDAKLKAKKEAELFNTLGKDAVLLASVYAYYLGIGYHFSIKNVFESNYTFKSQNYYFLSYVNRVLEKHNIGSRFYFKECEETGHVRLIGESVASICNVINVIGKSAFEEMSWKILRQTPDLTSDLSDLRYFADNFARTSNRIPYQDPRKTFGDMMKLALNY